MPETKIFVGSGVFWGGEENKNKRVLKFNRFYLHQTSDEKEIHLLKAAKYKEVKAEEIQKLIDAGKTPEIIRELIHYTYLELTFPQEEKKPEIGLKEVLAPAED